jgi:hypothetical protein
MGNVKKFSLINFKKVQGGKDPVKLINEFISETGYHPEKCITENSSDLKRWMVAFGDERELEILLEHLAKPAETSIYLGINVATVPIRGALDVLVSALEIADGLIGVKISLVGHYLVLSSSFAATSISSYEDIQYNYQLLVQQEVWFKEALMKELGNGDIEI